MNVKNVLKIKWKNAAEKKRKESHIHIIRVMAFEMVQFSFSALDRNG